MEPYLGIARVKTTIVAKRIQHCHVLLSYQSCRFEPGTAASPRTRQHDGRENSTKSEPFNYSGVFITAE
jgi:hypothetical protein